MSKDSVPACLIQIRQQSPALQDAFPTQPSTGTEQGNTWLVVTFHKTYTNAQAHTYLPSVPFTIYSIFALWDENMSSWSQYSNIWCIQLHHCSMPFLCTLADSLNFSCSGLLCSSYSTTPSGPLADASLLSPAVLPRLPFAASNWVSRRLWEGGKSHENKHVFNIAISLRHCRSYSFVVRPVARLQVFWSWFVLLIFSSELLPLISSVPFLIVYSHTLQ